MTAMPFLGLGATIRRQREHTGLTQEEVAAAAGVSVRTLRDLERGRVPRPRRQTVVAVARVIGLAAEGWEAPYAAGGPMIGLLGRFTVWRGDTEIRLAALPRRLLALLAVHGDQAVRRDRIAEVLWSGAPPPTSRNLIHSYVAGLRRALEPRHAAGRDRVVAWSGDGYRLTLAPEQLDATAFRADVAAARAALTECQVGQAEVYLRRAMRRWRGRLLDDAEPDVVLLPSAVQLAAERIDAALLYADTAHRLDRDGLAIPILQPLATDEPLHEDLQGRLIRALAGAGRSADALRRYDAVRTRLAEELGVDPTPELQAVRREVLLRRAPGGDGPDPPGDGAGPLAAGGSR